jgi:hypothetical protein
MTPRPCVHEAAVVQAVLSRRWPDACDASLRAHAEACEVCREVVAVAALLHEDFVEGHDTIARRDVPLPSAGQIWWRAAVRARAEAARTATRPLVWGYGAVAACAVGLIVAGVGALWPALRPALAHTLWPALLPALDRVASLTWWVPLSTLTAADALFAALKGQLPLVLGVAAFLVAMPVAIYLALREE